MGREIEALAKFVAETKWEDIPERVQRHAKTVLLDTLGVMLAGSVRPEVQKLRERLASNAGSGATLYAPGFASHDPRTAALLNGIGGRAIELCEGLRLVSGQAAIQILPGLLATGEATDRSGRDLLTALVLGYEIAGRLATAHTPRPLAHQNGQASLVAAAAAGARIRGMSAAEVSLAMRVSTTLVLTPSYTNAVAGATALNVAGGMSSFVGVLAPELVLAGFEAQPDAVEEALGKLVGDAFRTESLLENLGTRWHITENYFRLYACCNPIHPALDSLLHVLRELEAKPDEIERIDIATYRFASVMRNPDPPNFFASKYSLPHVAAVLAVKGRAGHSDVDDRALTDPAVVALRHRVHVSEDAGMSAVAPRLRPARVTLKLKDGRVATQACESHRGDFNRPFEESELREKFRELAAHVVSAASARRAEEAIDRAEQWHSVRDLPALFKEDLACST
jgi:2-methylcitrate dehydratase PrpD